jgi:hypothetical protein
MATNTVAKELLDLEGRFWQAMKDKDADAAVELLDDTGIVTGAQGATRLDRKTFVRMLKDQSWTIVDFEIADGADVLQLTDDVAVVAYRVRENLTVEGEPVTFEAADASTWVRRDGQWLCALHTESIIGDPFGRDRVPADERTTGASSRSR